LSILDKAKDIQAEQELKRIKAEAPSQFVVGGSFDGHKVVGGVSYQRSWKNGWGATAYAKAWWEDIGVTPTSPKGEPTKGAAVGFEATKKF